MHSRFHAAEARRAQDPLETTRPDAAFHAALISYHSTWESDNHYIFTAHH